MEECKTDWYSISNIDEIDTPALVFYPERVKENIRLLVSMIDDVKRLRPHVKTHKTTEATLLMMDAGIKKFKCATIAEAEMLGMAEAPDVLLGYQPVEAKLKRFLTLIKKYPDTTFSCLVDNTKAAKDIADAAIAKDIEIQVYLDINVGQNRTGILPSAAFDLYQFCSTQQGIKPVGLHAYDGQLHIQDFAKRNAECDKGFAEVEALQHKLIAAGFPEPLIIAGGSPSFPIHAKRAAIECSPGTFVFWDRGYQVLLPEQDFVPAALVIARVISLPGETRLCLDLGHKSIAAENELSRRVWFINAPDVKFISQSEEHLVVDAGPSHGYEIGDVFYGMPIHICPTCALYESAVTVNDGQASGEWKIIARDRKITV